MSNDLIIVKPTSSPRERIIARGHVLVTVCGIGALAAAVPGPTTAIAMMTGPTAASSSEPFGPAGDALLIAAGLLVWGLLAWITLLACSAALTRVPGIAGRMGRTVLGKIAPAAARNLLIAALGAALITQITGCAESGPGAGPAVAVAVLSTPGSGSATSTAAAWTAPPFNPTGTAAREVPSRSGGLTPTAPMPMLDWPTGGNPSPTSTADVPSANDRTHGGPDGTRSNGPAHSDSPGTVTTSRAPTNPVPTNPVPTNPVPTNPAPTNPVSTNPVSTNPGAPGTLAAGPATAGTPEDPATGVRVEPTAESPAQPIAPTTMPSSTADATITVTVQTGDSLWSIAADHLPADASDAHIDTTWRSWYRTNSAVIGDDPNLILPGQHLQPPAQEADQR